MKISKTLAAKVNFARFALNNNIEPFDLAELLHLVQQRANAAFRLANAKMDEDTTKKTDAADDRLIERIKEKGKTLGFNIRFDSAYPTVLDKDGKNVHLPL